VEGASKSLDLEFGLRGTMINDEAARIVVDCPPADGIIVYLWSHSWSAIASVSVDGGAMQDVNLYAKDPGWIPVQLPGSLSKRTKVEIRTSGRRDPRALGGEVIFFEALTYMVNSR